MPIEGQNWNLIHIHAGEDIFIRTGWSGEPVSGLAYNHFI